MPKKTGEEIQSERAELLAIMRPGDSLWECPKCRVQVLVEANRDFHATCQTCHTRFVSVQPHQAATPARNAQRGH